MFTEVTDLLGVDGDVFVSLLPLFLSELLGALGVLGELLLQVLDLRVVLVEALAQVLFHVFNLCVLRE